MEYISDHTEILPPLHPMFYILSAQTFYMLKDIIFAQRGKESK